MSRLTTLASLFVIVPAVTLFATSWLLARASEREHPPIGTLMSIDGLTVHVRDSARVAGDQGGDDMGANDSGADGKGADGKGVDGKGAGDKGTTKDAAEEAKPVILLLHGASTSLLDFETSLFPALASDYRVVSIDRPGHGYSEAPDDWASPYAQAAIARATLAALGIEKAVWAGHSWAGSVVLAGLLEESSSITAGVLLAGATHPWKTGVPWHSDMAATPVVGKLFSWLLVEPVGRLLLDSAIAAVFTPEEPPEGYVVDTGVTLSLRPETYRANARDLTRLSNHLEAQATRYDSIDRPLLSLTADGDDVVPAWNHDERLRKALPSVQSVSIDGAGHAFHHTRTDDVATLIRQFMRSLPD